MSSRNNTYLTIDQDPFFSSINLYVAYTSPRTRKEKSFKKERISKTPENESKSTFETVLIETPKI